MLNIAMISKWHVHADGYAKQIQESGDARISCVWDENPERGAKWAESLNVPFESDYDTLLARADVDAVLIDAPTSMHKDLMIRAAKAKKHIFTEKCMCLTVEDCDEVAKAVEENGVIFTISFPQRCWGRNLKIKSIVESGVLGGITLVRCRDAHDGSLADWLPDYWYDPETAGGGAMMDLGAHPMYLTRWLAGCKPTRVLSMFNDRTNRPVEDNAVCLVEYENGMIAVAETSLVSPMSPQSMEVCGEKGVILAEGRDKLRMRTKTLTSSGKDGWIELDCGKDLPSPIRQFLDSVLYGKPVLFGTKEGRELTELMQRAYEAHGLKGEKAF